MLAVFCAIGLAIACGLTLVAAANSATAGCNTRSCELRVREKYMRAIVAPYRTILQRIRSCETRGQPKPYRTNTGNGFYGAYQFKLPTWRSVGGRVRILAPGIVVVGPHTAPALEQDYRAALLYRKSGPGPWPVCGRP